MKTTLFLIFCLIINLTVLAQNHKEYWEDGKTLKEIGNEDNHGKQGEWKTFYRNGQIQSFGRFTNHSKIGEWKECHDNRQLSNIGEWSNDKKFGEWKFYDRNGEISYTGKYDNDQQVAGTWKTYNDKVQNVNCDCPPPKQVDYIRFCWLTKDKARATEPTDYTFQWELEIMKISCVDLKNDSRESINRKVNRMWNKYKLNFVCDRLGFNVLNGNILKFATNFNFPDFIYEMGDNFNVDFMFIDPADGKTFVQYLDEEIVNTGKNGIGRIREMQEIKDYVLEERKYDPYTQKFVDVKK